MKATLEIPDDLYAMVKARAALEGRTLRSVAIELLELWVATTQAAESEVVAEGTPSPWVALYQKDKAQSVGHDLAAIRAAIARGWAEERKRLLAPPSVAETSPPASMVEEEPSSKYRKDPSYTLDTSALIRLLVAAPAEQAAIATAFMDRCKLANKQVLLPNLVLAEAYFALQYHYGVRKETALEMLRLFALHGGAEMEPETLELLKSSGLARANPGFVDRLIHAEAGRRNSILVTFEKAAGKLEGARVLG